MRVRVCARACVCVMRDYVCMWCICMVCACGVCIVCVMCMFMSVCAHACPISFNAFANLTFLSTLFPCVLTNQRKNMKGGICSII